MNRKIPASKGSRNLKERNQGHGGNKAQMQMGKATFGVLGNLPNTSSITFEPVKKRNAFPERKPSPTFKPFDPAIFNADPSTIQPPVRKTSVRQTPTKQLDPIKTISESQRLKSTVGRDASGFDGNGSGVGDRTVPSGRHGKLAPLRNVSPTKSLQRSSPGDDEDIGALQVGNTLRVDDDSNTTQITSNKQVLPNIKKQDDNLGPPPTEKDIDEGLSVTGIRSKNASPAIEDEVHESNLKESQNNVEYTQQMAEQNTTQVDNDLSITIGSQLRGSSVSKMNDSPTNDLSSTIGSQRRGSMKPSDLNSTVGSNRRGSVKPQDLSGTIVSNKGTSHGKTDKNTKGNSSASKLKDENEFQRIMCGDFTKDLPNQRSSVIRIFLSSTFSDFKLERNYLQKHAYPILREYCGNLGFAFEVADLRWGITDDVANEHLVEKLCILEVENCKKISPGLNFICMLGDRYGYRALPAEIDATEYEGLMNMADTVNMTGLSLLKKWYQKDTNNIPAVYCLQPIKALIPTYAESDSNKRQQGRNDWDTQRNEMYNCLQQLAVKKLMLINCEETQSENGATSSQILKYSGENAHQLKKYWNSVTEHEIKAGVFTTPDDPSALCFTRHLEGIEQNLDNQITSRFIDVKVDGDSVSVDENIKELRNELQTQLSNVLPAKNVKKIAVSWKNPKGMSDEDEEQKKYLENFCQIAVEKMKTMVDEHIIRRNNEDQNLVVQMRKIVQSNQIVKKNVDTRKSNKGNMMSETDFLMAHKEVKTIQQELARMSDSEADSQISKSLVELHDEVIHHLLVAKEKVNYFTGRKNEIDIVLKYINSDGQKSPLIVHGLSGCGKTSFIARVAELVIEKKKKIVSILRFLGSSSGSSTLRNVFSSLCRQICVAYGLTIEERRLLKGYKAVSYFKELISLVSMRFGKAKPLIILLDSADKILSNDVSPLRLSLPECVHMIISMREDKQCHQILKEKSKSTNHFLQLGKVDVKDLASLIEVFLKQRGRTLAASQMQKVMTQVSKQSDPLYIRLILEASLSWQSFNDVSSQILPQTVLEAISNMFINLEVKYGKKFIEAIIGYISVSKDGISDNELEDTLSMNDDVMNELYKYHNPPIEGIVTLPALLYARVKYDLKEYLAEKLVYGHPLFYWAYQHFVDAASNKYAPDNSKKRLHLDLANMFLVEEPYLQTINLKQRNLVVENADRQITLQPLSPQNKRKLSALVYHLNEADAIELLKEKAVLNAEYLESYATAFGMSELGVVLDTLFDCSKDKEIELIAGAVKFEVMQSPTSLPSQLLCHLQEKRKQHKGIDILCNRITEKLVKPSILPNMKCVGISNSALRWYMNNVDGILPVYSDETLLVKRSKGLTIINQNSGQLTEIRMDKLPDNVAVTKDGKFVFVLQADCVVLYNAGTGSQIIKFSNRAQSSENLKGAICVCPDLSFVILANPSRLGKFHNVGKDNGELEFKPSGAMNLTGSQSVTDIVLFSESSTISAHSIKVKSGVMGALIVWNHVEQKITTKVGLPSLPVKGFLHTKKHSSIVVCGCQNGQIFLIDMEAGKIVSDLSTKPQKSKLETFVNAYDSSRSLLVAILPDKEISSWDISNNVPVHLSTYKCDQECRSIGLNGDLCTAILGLNEGLIGLLNIYDKKFKTSKADSEYISSLVCTDNDMVYTLGDLGSLKKWDIEALLSSTEKSPTVPNQDGVESLNDLEGLTCAAFTRDSKYLICGNESGITSYYTQGTLQKQHSNYKCSRKLSTITVSDVPRIVTLKNEIPMLNIIDQSSENVIDHIDVVYDYHVYQDNLHALATTTDHKPALLLYDWDRHFLVDSVTLLDHVSVDAIKLEGELFQEVDQLIVCKVSLMVNETLKVYLIAVKRIDEGHFDQSVVLKEYGEDCSAINLGKNAVLVVSQSKASAWCPLASDQSITDSTKLLASTVTQFISAKKGFTCHTVSEDRNTLVIGSGSGRVLVVPNSVVNESSVSKKYTLSCHGREVTSMILLQNSNYLITGSLDRTIKLWNLSDKTLTTNINTHAPIIQLISSPSSEYLAATVRADQGQKAFVFSIKI